MSELFDIQDEVARRIVAMLVGRIEDARLETAQRARPDDLMAYDLWLRGWSALKRADLAAIGEARRCFQQAVAKDPQFARAYVGLAIANLNEWAASPGTIGSSCARKPWISPAGRSSSTTATTGLIASLA